MRTLLAALVAALAVAAPAQASTLRVGELRADHLAGPMGIGDARPDLSWQITAPGHDVRQTAYQIRVSSDGRRIWDSGKVQSADSIGVPYAGPALQSRERLSWTVRVWGEHGGSSPWAKDASFELGLLDRSDWKGRWVADPLSIEKPTPPAVIRFPERRARYLRLDVTRLGLPLKEGWPDPVSRLQFSELEAYGGGKLLSGGAGVTASECYCVGGVWEPKWVTDGTTDSNRDPRGYTSYERHGQDTSDRPIWLEIDLGSVRTVDELRLYARTDTLTPDRRTANFPEDFRLSTREDTGAAWSEAYRAQGFEAPQPPARPDGMPLLARSFDLGTAKIRSARLYAAGLGVFEPRLNGAKVGDAVLEPANTDFRKRVTYSTYDVTDRLRSGSNTLGFMLGNGIYNVPGDSGRYTKFTGSMGPLKLIAQLEVTYADGTTKVIASDGSWRATSGPTTFSNWYGGEDYDARREPAGWDDGADLSSWREVADLGAPDGAPELSAQEAPPVRVQETLTAKSVKEVAPGVWLYDLGRNFAGWPELTLRGAAGQTATMRPAELLRDGRVSQAEIGSPVYFRFTPATDGPETWHPRFMYYGFRYVEVSGVDQPPALADVRGKVLRADNAPAGDVKTSDATLNATYDMVQRAVESNMLSVLTDCPHREKLGWLEESHLLYDTVAANFDVAAYYRKIVRDITDAQLPNGMVPDIAPEYTVFGGGFRDDANWGGAVIMAPYKHYMDYGDARPLRDAWPAMKRYMGYLATKASGEILSHGLGDWGAFDTNTPLEIPATTAYYRFANAMAEMAPLAGDGGAAASYEALAGRIKAAFNARFLSGGSYGTSQASNALPLAAGIVPADARDDVLAALRSDIAARGNHLSTGEIGLRALFDVLGDAGDADTVLAMATNPTAPSYAAMLASGATTLPEFWDGHGSQNHFMMGAIDDWSHRYLAGVRPTKPGFKEFVVAPLVPERLTSASASWASPYGTIESSWRRRGSGIELEVTVPANTRAEIRFPAAYGGRVLEVGSGHYTIESES
jgi:alpha-L-rhamnosidase